MIGFGVLALLVASVGIYAMFATMASAREREFGVRIALGSSRGAVAGLVIRQGGVWMALGLLLGAGGVFATTRLVRSQLFGVPAFDPLTILWQPYFSPPGKSDLTFSIATTRKVARYTLRLEGEETIDWPRGRIATERWHRISEDGNTEGWFWLAPSLHYIPVKMRVTRTSRGTLEVLLDSIRVDDPQKFGLAADMMGEAPASATQSARAEPKTADDIVYDMPGTRMPSLTAEELRGQ